MLVSREAYYITQYTYKGPLPIQKSPRPKVDRVLLKFISKQIHRFSGRRVSGVDDLCQGGVAS